MEQYTIWIVPTGDLQKKLKTVVSELSKRYKGPVFEPHMTLLGNVRVSKEEFVSQTRRVAKDVKPFTAQLGEVSFSSTYFQNVFVRVKSSAELIDLNWRVKKAFDVQNDVFMPHISLMYGEHDAETRERAANEVQIEKGLEFEVNKLVITPATPDPSTWEHLEEVFLG